MKNSSRCVGCGGGCDPDHDHCRSCRRVRRAATHRIADGEQPPERRTRIPQREHWAMIRGVVMAAGLDPVRLETKSTLGIPDVNYRDGWMELKQIPAWPRTRGAPVRIKLSPGQKAWIRRRVRAGGEVVVSLMVGAEHMLVAGDFAAGADGVAPRAEWEAADLTRRDCRLDIARAFRRYVPDADD